MRSNRVKKARSITILLLSALLLTLVLALLSPFPRTARAAEATDEIEHFIITVDVQEDASLQMTYHIDWKVLDDDTYGPLEWVDIGLPNSHHSEVTARSGSISRIEDKGSSLAIYLDRSYSEDETVSFEFSFVQDNMYQIDRYAEGETVYIYTPAWFDGIEVKDLTIRWNADKAGAWQPDCQQENGYLVFSASLSAGERFTMTVAYPSDAFGFAADHQSGDSVSRGEDASYSKEDSYYSEEEDWPYMIIGLVTLLAFIAMPAIAIIRFIQWIGEGLGFGSSAGTPARKKIVRTKIEYFDNCPSCGAAREEGKDNCPYCGRSMIKSKEIIIS